MSQRSAHPSPEVKVGSSQKALKDPTEAKDPALVSSGCHGAEKLVSFLEHCLHVLELSQLAGLIQPQPAVGLVLAGEADLHIVVLYFRQPVDDGFRLLPGHIIELLSEAFNDGQLACIYACFLLSLPQGCLQVTFSWFHVAFGRSPVMNAIGGLQQ
uniref:Bis(5'-nucleosyl)-tetraphosphatase asymmetrical n=1 Tax=Sus scrofa TaxID=9823 RepID=A0A480HBP2_PIG